MKKKYTSIHNANPRLFGYLLSLASAFCSSSFAISYAHLAEVATPLAATFIIFAGSLLGSVIFSFLKKEKFHLTTGWNKKVTISIFLICLLTILGNAFFSESVKHIPTAIAQLAQRTEIIFVVLFGVFLMREPWTKYIYLGLALVVIGFVVLRMDHLEGNADLLPLLYAILSGFCFASFQALSKVIVVYWSPSKLNIIRLVINLLFLLLIPGLFSELFGLGAYAWIVGFFSGISGPFLGRILMIYSIRYLEISKSVFISALTPIITGIILFILYGKILTGIEIFGSAIIMAGILISIIRVRPSLNQSS